MKILARLLALTLSIEVSSCCLVMAASALWPSTVPDPFLDRHFAQVDDDDRERFLATAWDREVGWIQPSIDGVNAAGERWSATIAADGSRWSPRADESPWAAVYGNSFALAAEVNDLDAWTAKLEDWVGARVANFGVAGYGTGQAVLRAERHWRAGRVAPITVLAIYENDVERLTAFFRPLQVEKSSGLRLGFKPAFVLDASGGLVVEPSLYDDPALSLDALHRRARDRASGAILRPPFALQAARIAGARIQTARNPYDPDVESGAVMRAVVARFVRGADQVRTRPIVLFIPARGTLREQRPPGYAELARELAQVVEVVDVAQASFDRRLFNVAPFKGHASAYGNRVIAREVARASTRAAAWQP